MAEKRMFTMKIIDSDEFLDMPLSTQALYFHLNMRADDDGFINNPRRIQRTVGTSDDDLKLLIAKRFVICFENGVIVIKHWRMHNTLRKDRYKPTQYQEEYARLGLKENNAYTERQVLPEQAWQPDGNQPEPQYREDKNRLVEIREEEIREEPDDERPASPVPYETIKSMYNEICLSFPRCKALSEARKKTIKARFKNGYTEEDFKTLFTKAEASSFLKGKNSRSWSATFDWLIKDTNMAKVLDGNFDDHRKGGEKNGTTAKHPGEAELFGTYL